MRPLTKLIIIAAAGVAAVLLLVVLAVRPVYESVTNQQVLLQQKQIELNQLSEQFLAFQAAAKDLDKAGRAADIAGRVVSRDNLVAPVAELELAASKSSTFEILDIKNPD